MPKQNLKFLGLLAVGVTLSVFLVVSGLASIFPSVRKTAQKSQIPFMLIGEPQSPQPTKIPLGSTMPLQTPKAKKQALEQIEARLFSKRPQDLQIADLNKDGVVNMIDYLMAR